MARRAKRNYVNNPDLYDALIAYKSLCKEREEQGKSLPQVPLYIAECFMQISKRLASRPNFSGYPFKEDMQMDGVEACLKYINNFNGEKYENPFAYFTQVIWNAFINRIKFEKKQMYITFKMSQELISSGGTYDGGGEDVSINLNTSAEYINDFIEDFESKLPKNKKKAETE
jgi:hypothetical protein